MGLKLLHVSIQDWTEKELLPFNWTNVCVWLWKYARKTHYCLFYWHLHQIWHWSIFNFLPNSM